MTATVLTGTKYLTDQAVYIKQMAGNTPAPKTDLTVGSATFASLGGNPTGVASGTPMSYSQDAYFTAPATVGDYRYYSFYPGSATGPSYSNGFAMSVTSPVKVTTAAANDSCVSKYGALQNTYIKANNSATDDTGYQCAYVEQNEVTLVKNAKGVLEMRPPWPFIPLKVVTDQPSFVSSDPYCWTRPSSLITVLANLVKGTSASSPSYLKVSMTNSQSSTSNSYSSTALWMVPEQTSTPYAGQYKVCGTDKNYTNAIVNANLMYKVGATLSANGPVSAASASDWTVTTSPRYATDTVSVTSATVKIMQMLGSAPSTTDPVVGSGTVTSDKATVSVTPHSGALAFYADVDGSKYVTPTLPSRGWTAARSSIVDFGATSSGTTRMALSKGSDGIAGGPATSREKLLAALKPTQLFDVEASGSNGKTITAMCPSGFSIQTMSTLGDVAEYLPYEFVPTRSGEGITLKTRGKETTRLHLDCRSNLAKAVVAGQIGRGSIHGDQMTTTAEASVITGGLGADTLTTSHSRSALFGGFGDDRLVLKADATAASGGPGDDVLSSTAASGLLNGGGGRDAFTTGSGEVRVNARDGRPGDTVTCGSAATKVLADKGDVLKGPCTVVKYQSSPEDPTQAGTVTSGKPDVVGRIAVGNGSAGIAQVVSVIAPALRGTTVALTATNGAQSMPLEIALDGNGQGSLPWTPLGAGSWTITASDTNVSLETGMSTISAMPTVTSLYVPDKATRFQPTLLAAVVEAGGGQQPVTGTVAFYEVNQGKIGEQDVTTLPGDRALASIQWTPSGEATYAFYAKFTPSSLGGIPALQPSDSNSAYLTVRTAPSIVQLLMPPVMRIGKPVLVMASLPAMYAGTVSLKVDDRDVSPPKETLNGYTAFVWTPTHTGLTYVTLTLQSDRFARLDREVTQTIDVQPQLPPNPISVTPVVAGVAGKPWAEDDVLELAGGTQVDLVSSTGNGAGVTIAQRGPCALNGSRLVLPKAGGGCRVTISAPGDARFGPNSAELLLTASATKAP